MAIRDYFLPHFQYWFTNICYFAINREKLLYNAYFVLTFNGLVTYATYDLTNYATIKDWPFAVTIVDIIWGMFVAFASSSAAFLFHKYFV